MSALMTPAPPIKDAIRIGTPNKIAKTLREEAIFSAFYDPAGSSTWRMAEVFFSLKRATRVTDFPSVPMRLILRRRAGWWCR